MSETLNVKIKLSSKNWEDRFPCAKIYFGKELVEDLGEVRKPVELSYDFDLAEGKHCLSIEMYGKKSGDTQQDEDKNIINDVILNIDSIEFDEIVLGHLIHNLSTYYPDASDAPGVVKNCVNLGWNGRWDLEFESPVYLWLLENM